MPFVGKLESLLAPQRGALVGSGGRITYVRAEGPRRPARDRESVRICNVGYTAASPGVLVATYETRIWRLLCGGAVLGLCLEVKTDPLIRDQE
jgi:hypothetical protein